MGGSDDTRAVSEVMGAILVFSLLVTALGAYQAVIVPNQNEEVEFKHNNGVQRDVIDLRNSIHRSATDGEDTSTSVDLGVSYPVRALTLNPPEQGGTLQGVTTSGSTQDLAIENARAIDREVDDYWDSSTKEFTTGKVVYAPSYSIYRNAPRTVVENGLVYNKFDDANDIPLSGQGVVSGREISLVAIESDLARSQVDTTAVDVNAVSGTPTKIAVTNASSGDNVTIRIPTNLSEEVWVSQLLADQFDGPVNSGDTCSDIGTATNDDPDQYIHDCTYTTGGSSEFNVLTLEMERNETYTLKLSKVSVGKTMAAPGPHYIVPLEGNNVSVPGQGNQRLVLQVRDRFNNPVSGAKVNVSIDPAETTTTDSETLVYNGRSNDTFTDIRTNENGRIALSYQAQSDVSSSPNEVEVRASFANATTATSWNASTRQNTTFDISVINASKIDRTAPLFNPEKGIIVTAANFTNNGCSSPSTDCRLNIRFKNTAGEEQKLTGGRYVFYTGDSQGASPSDPSGLAVVESTIPDTDLILADETESLNSEIVFADGEEKTIQLKLYEGETTGSSQLDITEGEYFVFSFIIDGERRETYFVAPADGN